MTMPNTVEQRARHGAESMGRVRHLHFVGVGGAGMSGIAEVMLNLGYQVSGSDLKQGAVTERLRGLGVQVHIGHRRENIEGADAVIVSSAVNEANPEVREARALRIPVVPRAEMLAELMRFHYGIAVAGTHGKTTTTSLVASLLAEGELDPTFVIGGRLNSAGANARLGTGRYLVAEADESDASFLYLQPTVAVVTNIDADHMGTYGNDFNRLRSTFVEFLHHLPFYGLAVLCVDDEEVRSLLPEVTRPVRTYGTREGADVRAVNIRQSGHVTRFAIESALLSEPLELALNLPGRHNVLNALAAVCVALELGVGEAPIRRALESFQGIGRRFQVNEGSMPDGRRLMLVDDYAHHPREIQATLEAARAGWPERRVVVLFQPHRYSRTKEQFEDFVQVLSQADLLVLAEVYPAGEEPVPGADGRSLCRALRTRGEVEPVFVEEVQQLPELLPHLLLDGDLVLTLGAGDIGVVASRLPAVLLRGEETRQ
jgi:UDP-N-acetylmuramate--alanine ligase